MQMTMATTKSVEGLRMVSCSLILQSVPWKPSTQLHTYPPISASKSWHLPPWVHGCHSSHSLMLTQSPKLGTDPSGQLKNDDWKKNTKNLFTCYSSYACSHNCKPLSRLMKITSIFQVSFLHKKHVVTYYWLLQAKTDATLVFCARESVQKNKNEQNWKKTAWGECTHNY